MPIELEKLLPYVGGPFPRLDCVCDHEHLLKVAKKLRNWRTAAPWFGFDRTVLQDLERSSSDEEGMRQEMLFKWAEENGCGSTYRALAKVLLKHGSRSLAEDLLKMSKETKVCNQPVRGPKPSSRSPTHATFRSATTVTRAPSDSTLVASQQPFSNRQDKGSLPQSPEMEQHLSFPMQSNDDSLTKGMMLVSSPAPHYPTDMHEKFSSVFAKAASCGIPDENTAEMKQLKRRVERLEEDKKIANQRNRRLQQNMKAERIEHKDKIKLLTKQLGEAEHDVRESELIQAELKAELQQMKQRSELMRQQFNVQLRMEILVAQLRVQIEQMRIHKDNCTGQSCTDCPFKAPSSNDTGGIAADSGEGQKGTMVVSGGCLVASDSSRSKEIAKASTGCNPEHKDHEIIDNLRQCMDECYFEMEKHFNEQLQSEMAEHHHLFLQVNNRMTAVVSQSLECLSGNDDINCAGLEEDLRWLKKNLSDYTMPQRSSSCP